MAFQLFKRTKKTVNIMFSDQAIRFIEATVEEQPKILRWAEHPIGRDIINEGKIIDAQTLRLIMEECVDNWRIKRRHVQFLVPDPYIVIRPISIPGDVRDDEMKGHIFLEIGSSIHLPFEDPVFDVTVLQETASEKEVLLVAAPQEVVKGYVDLLEDVKLKPTVADISPLSLYRLYQYSGMSTGNDHIMLLHMDEDLLTISIFHNHVPIFIKPLPMNREPIAISMNVLEEQEDKPHFYLEDVFLEIEKIMDFYIYSLNQGNAQVERIFLSGGHPQLKNIKEMLAEYLSFSIEQLSGEYCLSSTGEVVPLSCLPCIGLALKEVTP
ncbi:type IV pilus biogenesis protein PilM [Lederbergia citrea]|uniref:type IV pilus biogenesis protein PilM n=1 Tax=Lederbergia citrea TaxID=2833581 RepID=UPI001BCA5F5B|nr:pilus assembly protein PilM [Lederbergia citrea]MBS4176189.1 pilus assembly protein PilM [Lederbergia citrea]